MGAWVCFSAGCRVIGSEDIVSDEVGLGWLVIVLVIVYLDVEGRN